MHYYQFNIADYRKDTVHLTAIEHYIYRSLIDWYYLDEMPIPKITQVVMRRLSLSSENEQCLLNVLNDFFKLDENGWNHTRINQDIIEYHAKALKNKVNGKKGGRPPKPIAEPQETQVVIDGLPDANPSESQINPNHKPLTINHKPEGGDCNSEETTQKTLPAPSTPYGEVAKALVAVGMQTLNTSNPTFMKLVDAGASPQEFVDAMQEQKSKHGKTDFNYIVAMVKGRRADAAKLILHQGAMPATTSREQGRNIAARSIFTPENTQHLQGNQLKTIEVEHEQRAITA